MRVISVDIVRSARMKSENFLVIYFDDNIIIIIIYYNIFIIIILNNCGAAMIK